MEATTFEAWQCSKCQKIYQQQDVAEKCCAPKFCRQCKRSIEAYFIYCHECRSSLLDEKFSEADEGPTNGPFVFSDVLNEYIDVDYVGDRWSDDPPDGFSGNEPLEVIIKHWRLHACQPDIPEWIGISEWGVDYLGDDCDGPPGEWEKVDQAFADYLESCGAWSYVGTKIRWNGDTAG